jgi:hypothetical protein
MGEGESNCSLMQGVTVFALKELKITITINRTISSASLKAYIKTQRILKINSI